MFMEFVNARPPLEIAASASAALLGAYWTTVAFYRLFLSPLRKVPGPLVRTSGSRPTFYVFGAVAQIDDLLREYGPTVRIAPNKVIFNDVSAKLDKSEFYSSLKTYVYDILSLLKSNLVIRNGNDQA